MNTRLFLVDVESTGPSPANSVMTEFGVVDFETREWFHGHIWDFEPTPGIPALPIATKLNVGYTSSKTRGRQTTNGEPMNFLYFSLAMWMRSFDVDKVRAVFVSDNPGWDFMWIAYGFDSAGLENPFGHSSRRIGDFAAGLAGNWKQQTKWKSLRETRHTHNPVDDAMGNAEALAKLLEESK